MRIVLVGGTGPVGGPVKRRQQEVLVDTFAGGATRQLGDLAESCGAPRVVRGQLN